MLSPTEEHLLRDLMTIQLLLATSHPEALERARAAERRGTPAYDPVPAPGASIPHRLDGLASGDLVDACALCGRMFVVQRRNGPRPHRFCSVACADLVNHHRRRRGLAA